MVSILLDFILLRPYISKACSYKIINSKVVNKILCFILNIVKIYPYTYRSHIKLIHLNNKIYNTLKL